MKPGDPVAASAAHDRATDRRGLVVGYGNTLRRDDGVGVRAAELMAEDPRFAGIEVLTAYQLTPELALDIAAASLVVFVDADVRGLPGSIEVRELGTVRKTAAGSAADATAAGPLSRSTLAGAAGPDARLAGGQPGRADAGASSHHVGADEVLALARQLVGAAPRAFALGIGVADLELGEGLSAPVEAALPRVLDVVARLVTDHAQG
jgi:hydrogenase maturation protease